MKFLCSYCKAKYQIADEKVAGRALRMVCRNCKQEIVIHGDTGAVGGYPTPSHAQVRTPSPLVAPPSPLGADFQLQVGGSLRAPLAPQPIDEWHVGINDTPIGPIRREEVARKLAGGMLNADSLAWREGLDDWLPIRAIPELAVLCAGGIPSSPPPLLGPAQRADLAPIGGRAGAAPAYAIEDWAPVMTPMMDPNPSQISQVSINPMLERRAPGAPSLNVMFVLAGAFALLTSGLVILGVRWLSTDQRPVAAAPAAALPAAGSTQTQPGTAQPGSADPSGEMVIGLDDPALQNGMRANGRPRSGDPRAAAAAQQNGKSKKELTAEQKAMLARMGGGDAPSDLTNLRAQGGDGQSAHAATGTLSSEDVAKVVVRGRQNLQRCYETALRGANSDETVRMNVEMVVSPNGNVTSVKTSGDGLPGMAQCIERTVRMWRFPSSSDSSPVKFPLLFSPGS